MANTDKELVTDAITSSGSLTENTGKNLSGAGNMSASVLKSSGKILSGSSTTTSTIDKDIEKNLSVTPTITPDIQKATHKYLGQTVTVTATKEVNDAKLTMYYGGNTALGLGAQNGARFNIIVTGSFDFFSIEIGDKILIYTETVSGQSITIDNVNATCKNGTVNKIANLTGDTTEFLTLQPGDNVITYSKSGGNVNFVFDFIAQYV
jgi:hypothetical protein